ncbi:hypothetical protein ACFL50_04320 [Candidatus Latescibacterota bacterium]
MQKVRISPSIREVIVDDTTITEKDRARAQKCLECYACKRARKKQKGLIFWFVKHIEGGICPYCKAYERVYGRKAHVPIPTEDVISA